MRVIASSMRRVGAGALALAVVGGWFAIGSQPPSGAREIAATLFVLVTVLVVLDVRTAWRPAGHRRAEVN